MNMTHPDILRIEKDGTADNRHCYCGNVIYDDSRFCQDCENEYINQQDEDAEDRRLFDDEGVK